MYILYRYINHPLVLHCFTLFLPPLSVHNWQCMLRAYIISSFLKNCCDLLALYLKCKPSGKHCMHAVTLANLCVSLLVVVAKSCGVGFRLDTDDRNCNGKSYCSKYVWPSLWCYIKLCNAWYFVGLLYRYQ